MTNSENPRFYFSDERREKHAHDLRKVKPLLPRDRIEFFLYECERELTNCLRNYPNGWRPTKKTPERLRAVWNAANLLGNALEGLSETERLSLFAGVLLGHDCGYDVRQAHGEYREMKKGLLKIQEEADWLISGHGTPISQRFSDDFARHIAFAYVTAFSRLPSYRPDSIYAQFVADVASNDIHSNWCPPPIGWRTLKDANSRVTHHLEAVLSRSV